MAYSGNLVRAGDPTRVASLQETADITGVTTVETVVSTLNFQAVAGITYQLNFNMKLLQTVANDVFIFTVREDSITGSTVDSWAVKLPAASFGMMYPFQLDWTASIASTKTIVGTFIRNSGTGSITRAALSNYQVKRVS